MDFFFFSGILRCSTSWYSLCSGWTLVWAIDAFVLSRNLLWVQGGAFSISSQSEPNTPIDPRPSMVPKGSRDGSHCWIGSICCVIYPTLLRHKPIVAQSVCVHVWVYRAGIPNNSHCICGGLHHRCLLFSTGCASQTPSEFESFQIAE